MGRIKLHIADEHVKLCISEDSIRLAVAEAKPVYIGGEPYTGEYFVIPKVDEQTVLETKAKLMEQNVTVERIPIYEAANAAGGNTLSIGEMYYG